MTEIRVNAICTECQSDTIFYDKHRAEIYCSKCGLVLVQLHNPQIHNLFNDYNFNDFKEMQNYKSINELLAGASK